MVNEILVIYNKHGNENNFKSFINYLISILYFDYIPKLHSKLKNPLIQNLIKNIPIKYLYNSVEEINTIRNEYIKSIDDILKDNLNEINIDVIKNPVLYYTSYHGFCDVELYQKYNKLIEKFNKKNIEIVESNYFLENQLKIKKDKVKVGFIQPYFRTDAHAVSRISNDLIRHLQNEQVEVIIIKNNTSKNDILDLKLDVLVYITIGTDAYTYDTSFYRLAPVQCNFWGHINTSGKRHIDYFITSKLFESEQKYFSEKLVNFDSLSTYIIKNDELKTSFLQFFKKRSFFCLPENKTILFYPHAIFKIHPNYDVFIKKICESNENIIIVFFITSGETIYKSKLFNRWEKNLKDCINQIRIINPFDLGDIEDIPKKFIYDDGGSISRFYYHNMMYISDFILDSFPFGGCITTLDSIYWDKIMITNPNIIRAKFTSGFYNKIGLSKIVPKNEREFFEILNELMNNSEYRLNCEKVLKNNSYKIYKNEESLKEWRNFLLNIVSI